VGEGLFKCQTCGSSFGHAGALSNHVKTHARPPVSTSPLSGTLLQQIEWLNQKRTKEADQTDLDGPEEFEGVGDIDEDFIDEEEAEIKVDGRRGRARRYRVTVKYKWKLLQAFDEMQHDLHVAAEKSGEPLQNISQVIDAMLQTGLQESKSNIYHWLEQRKIIEERYLRYRLRKRKTVGSGQSPMLSVTEAAVKELIVAKRNAGLRVSRLFVRTALKEKAQELEPDISAQLKFSRSYFSNAFRRMDVVVRRISSSKAVKEDMAADYGRFFLRQIMLLRENGSSSFFPDNGWCTDLGKDSVFGYFEPCHIFAADEVPFNFAAEGKTLTVKGSNAAVRTLRGTGKRFGTCVVICDGDGNLLKFVIIFKGGKKGLPPAEVKQYAEMRNVIVTHSKSSYITESLWSDVVVGKVLFEHLRERWGRDFYKRRYLFLSDNHGSHQTEKALAACYDNAIYPAFTPPNFTSHWSLIDDYVGTAARAIVYQKAEDYEEHYFKQKPDGDGAVAAGERRVLSARWWNEAFDELKDSSAKEKRVAAAKRVGLYVLPQKPADTSYLPCPVRFKNSPFQFFGETLYDHNHPDYSKEKSYDFSFPKGKEIVVREVQALDEDGYSNEEGCVWLADEEVQDELSDLDSDDVDALKTVITERRSQRQTTGGSGKIVQQFADLNAVDGWGKKKKKR
jgi:hypothetical protein